MPRSEYIPPKLEASEIPLGDWCGRCNSIGGRGHFCLPATKQPCHLGYGAIGNAPKGTFADRQDASRHRWEGNNGTGRRITEG